MQACAHCGAANPDENGYCVRCYGLLEPAPLPPPSAPRTYRPYLMWDRWPWAPLRTVTQSQDQFVIAMVIQAIATVAVAAALAVAMTVALGPLAAAVAALAVTASSIGGNYARWRAGRRRAAWYARDHP